MYLPNPCPTSKVSRIQTLPSSRLFAEPRQKNPAYLPVAGRKRDGFIPFLRALAPSETQAH